MIKKRVKPVNWRGSPCEVSIIVARFQPNQEWAVTTITDLYEIKSRVSNQWFYNFHIRTNERAKLTNLMY
jgi:hypothetical protein